jgi:hypothetical protein
MQQQAALRGREALPRWALRLQRQLVSFALVFRVSAGAVHVLGEPLSAGRLQSGAPKARVAAWRAARDLEHHTACA